MIDESKIPSDWKVFRLSDLANVTMGQSPNSETYNIDGNGSPFVQGNADLGNINPIVRIYTTNPKKFSEPGEILLTVRAPVGAMNINDKHIAIGRGIASISEFDKTFYLYHYLIHNQWLMKRLEQGTTFTEINQREIKRLHIASPILPEARINISETINKINEAVDAVKNSIAKVEQLKKAMMQNLLTGKLKPDGIWRKDNDFIETRLGNIPNDWITVRANQVCFKVTDGTHETPSPSIDGKPLVTSKNLIGTGIDLSLSYLISQRDFIEVNRRSKVDQYDVLYGMIGTIGNPQIVMDEEVNFAIKNVGLFKTGSNLTLAKWLKNYFESPIYNLFLQRRQAGTTQSFVSLSFLRKLPILFPKRKNSENEIDWMQVEKINEKFEVVNRILQSKQIKIKRLENLKKAFMQNLLTGKVRVKI